MSQERLVSEEKVGDSAQLKRLDGAGDGGYNFLLSVYYGGAMGCDPRHAYTGMLPENGQSMYYAPGYEFAQQSAYCPQPQGAYVSNVGSGATGYCVPQYGPYYQQLSPALMQQYFPMEQEVSKPGSKKPYAKDSTQNTKSKPGVQGNLEQQGGHKNPLQSDTPNHLGFYPGAANGGFYGSSMGYDCYMPQQWQMSTRGFQPLPLPQNIGAHGNCVPPLPGVGPGHYQNFPRVHSTPTMSGRVLKGCSVKGGTTGGNWRAKEVTKSQGKGEGPANNGLLNDACEEQTKKLCIPRVTPGAVQGIGDRTSPPHENLISSVFRTDYNKEDFQISYGAAKFFIIKSYSEDDVHKSIKYSVWSSTPNGNKRLDEAYRKAQERLESSLVPCPVFFFFSVNCSGQFCGVAEMVGSVDFGKNMDFWLQEKWNGCLPVKWHIIKDVPNGHFRHIILTNNDNKPVTHSRDTQEVLFHQGLEVLKIFKYFPTRTSLLDDFGFYDQRQRFVQERKSKQQLRQQALKQNNERASEKMNSVCDALSDYSKENDRPVKPAERVDSPSTDSKEVTRSVVAEVEKREVADILLKVMDIKLGENAEPQATAENAEPQATAENADDCQKDTREKVTPVALDKACKSKARKDTCIAKEISICTGKETSIMLDPITNGGDKNCMPRVASGGDDTSRMAITINYKKALLEGIQGKSIVLGQTVGA